MINIRLSGLKKMSEFSFKKLLGSASKKINNNSLEDKTARLPAKVISGLGVANRNLARQLPYFISDFSEVSDCWPGTINLELPAPIKFTNPDHQTDPIAWTPSGTRTEVFSFVRIELEFSNLTEAIPGWIYIAHNSPHRKTPHIHEVITRYIDIKDFTKCYIHIRESTFNNF